MQTRTRSWPKIPQVVLYHGKGTKASSYRQLITDDDRARTAETETCDHEAIHFETVTGG